MIKRTIRALSISVLLLAPSIQGAVATQTAVENTRVAKTRNVAIQKKQITKTEKKIIPQTVRKRKQVTPHEPKQQHRRKSLASARSSRSASPIAFFLIGLIIILGIIRARTMMKKLLTAIVFMAMATPMALCGRGGDAAIGGFAGSMVGSVIGNAMTRDSRRDSRAQEDARQARRETQELRKERERDKDESRRERERDREIRELREKLEHSQRTSPMVLFLIGLIIALGIALVIVGFLLTKRRP